MMKNLHALSAMNTNVLNNKQTLKSLAFFLLFNLLTVSSYSQTPSDSPCGDPAGSEFTVQSECNFIPWGFTGGETNYWFGFDAVCTSFSNSDIWGWFDATSTTTTITWAETSFNFCFVSEMYVFDAGVGGSVACDPFAAPVACLPLGSLSHTISMPTIIGNRYRIRVTEGGCDPGGEICVFSPPPNDFCTSATVIDCSTTNLAGSTFGATDISSANTTCGMGDVGVWYTFVGDGQEWTITTQGLAGFDPEMAVLTSSDGTCSGTFTSLDCVDDDTGVDGLGETYNFVTTIGTTYYVYIASYLTGSTQQGDFTISVSCTPAPSAPPNDEPCNATPLSINGDYLCSVVTPGTVFQATESFINGCAGIENNDVWFSFVATGTAHSVDVINVSGGTDMAVAVYDGDPFGCAVTQAEAIQCFDDPDGGIFGGLTIGSTYYVQVYTYFLNTSNATFDVCVGSPPPPPSNDDPCGAPELTVNTDLACGTTSSGTVLSALNTGVNICQNPSSNDVWFWFEATSTAHVIQLLNIAGSTLNLDHAIYGPFADASLCTPAELNAAPGVACNPFNTGIVSGLNVGDIYFVQVYTPSTLDENTTFDICVGTPPIVANDEPCGAFDLSSTINGDFLCATTTPGTIEWATDSGFTTCGGTANDDVWYRFKATSLSHSVNLLTISGSTIDLDIGIYGGFATGTNCDSVAVEATNLLCSATTGTSFATVIDEWYYIQVYSNGAADFQTSSYLVCIGTPPPAPLNDDPCDAETLVVDQACITTTGSIASATNSNIDACTGVEDDDVWYVFQATAANQTITLLNVFGSTSNLNHAVYGGFNIGDCSVIASDLITGGCSNPNSSNLTGLTVGDWYFIQVYTNTGTIGQTTTFDICVTEPCNDLGPIITTPTVCPLISGPTGINPFTATPFDPDPLGSLDCLSSNLTLEAYSNINETTSYIVEQIPNPTTTEYSAPGFGGNPEPIPFDDVWADSFTPIPFNFCFYGTTYTQLLVGSNGMITFDPAYTPGSSCGWSFNDNLPSNVSGFFQNTIYSVYQDLNPFGTTNPVTTWVDGDVGCRTLSIAFNDVPLFSDDTRRFTGKTVLYETTNVIEIYIKEKFIENGNVNPWNGGNAIAGIQGNSTLGEAVVAPCRNGLDDNWATQNEAWRFVPTGAAITPDSVTWYDGTTGAEIGSGNTVDVTSANTYSAIAEYTVCGATVTLQDAIVVGLSQKTWTGATDTNWYKASNWNPAAIPTAVDCVTIPVTGNDPTADISNLPIPLPPTTAYALNLTIEAGANLRVLSGTNLVVTDYLNLDGTIDIDDSGSLIQINNIDNNIGDGNITMERTVSAINPYDYIYWSSPIKSFGVGNVSPGSTKIYDWVPTIPANLNGYGDWAATNPSSIMQPGKGYIIRNIVGTPTPNTPRFVGKPNNGTVTQEVRRGTYNGAPYLTPSGAIGTNFDDNWNLVGNPYPSAISANAFITRNATNFREPSVITGAVWLWRHLSAPSTVDSNPFYADFVYNYNPNDYITYNNSGSTPPGFNGDIAAGQAFFVSKKASGSSVANVIFVNSMRNETLDNSQFYRTEEPLERHRIWLDLISPNNTANSILVGYIENATDGFDNLFDAHELSETPARFYSLVEGEAMSIQGRALPFDDTDSVPLGIEIPQNGNYTIAINTIDGLFLDTNQAIYLDDTYNGIVHDLRVNPYSFNAEVGIYEERFVLRFNNESLSVDDFNNTGLEILAPNNASVKVISGNSPISAVTLYDLLGRVLIDKREINNSEFTIQTSNYADGAYIVRAVLADGKQKLQKVVIKN